MATPRYKTKHPIWVFCFILRGSEAWNRTKIDSFKGCCPTFRRSPNNYTFNCRRIAKLLDNTVRTKTAKVCTPNTYRICEL